MPEKSVDPGWGNAGVMAPVRRGLDGSPRSPWLGLHRPAKGPPRARLLIIPFAGGNASAFYPWLAHLGPAEWLEVAVVQPPGRGPRFREPPLTSLEEYASAVAMLAQDLEREHGASPLTLMGYSMGPLVAYLALRDHGASLPAAHLIVAARSAPSSRSPCERDAPAMTREQLLARLRRLQGTPESLLDNPGLIEPYLASIASEFQLVDGWTSQFLPPVQVDLTVIAALEDPETPLAGALNWELLTEANFLGHIVRGGHFFMNSARETVCAVVNDTIAHTIEGDTE